MSGIGTSATGVSQTSQPPVQPPQQTPPPGPEHGFIDMYPTIDPISFAMGGMNLSVTGVGQRSEAPPKLLPAFDPVEAARHFAGGHNGEWDDEDVLYV